MKLTTYSGGLVDTRRQRRLISRYIRGWRKQTFDFTKDMPAEDRADTVRRFRNTQRRMKRQHNFQLRMYKMFNKMREARKARNG